MGWDYFTFMSQPTFFIEEILESMNADNKCKEAKNNKKSNE